MFDILHVLHLMVVEIFPHAAHGITQQDAVLSKRLRTGDKSSKKNNSRTEQSFPQCSDAGALPSMALKFLRCLSRLSFVLLRR